MSEANDVRRKEKPDMLSANAGIDLDVLVEKVYRLMQADLRMARTRRGKTRIGG